jgi:murein DD-endopeptidase MepM/ murein hydrolase activator NlpD
VEVSGPPSVPQGGVLVVEVKSTLPLATVRAEAEGRAMPFAVQGSAATGLLGFRSDARPGVAVLTLMVTAVNGSAVRREYPFQMTAATFPVEHIQVDEDEEDLLAPAVLNTEWQRLQGIAARISLRALWSGPFLRPVGAPVSSAYGTRRSYNSGPPGSPHEGVDFASGVGDPVMAANDGVAVVSARWDVRGEAVVIDHGLGVYSGYYHLSERLVAQGQTVTRGQVIGRVGATGLVTGPHLHWDMIAQGANTSPLEWTQRVLP